jgi:hypothetical protein
VGNESRHRWFELRNPLVGCSLQARGRTRRPLLKEPTVKRTLVAGAAGLALTLPLSLALAAPASAAPKGKGACVQAGIGTLKELGRFQEAAQKKIDYSTLADPRRGPIFADLEPGSNLSLGQVVKLHTTNPELFAWCR